jgi:Divergent InlB B-repeat domain/NHL repeat
MRMSKPRRKESTSEEWRLRALRRIVALFAALVVSLTLTAAASADVSFIKAYGWGVADGASQFETCTSTCQTGLYGGGAGQFNLPYGIATDSSGDVYVADTLNKRIDEFSAAGAFIKAYGWGVSDGEEQFEICTSTCRTGFGGGGAGQIGGTASVAVDPSGDVYVADAGASRIDEFSAAGAFIKAYGWGVLDGASQFETCTSTCQTGLYGGGAGQFYSPWGIATDSSGDVYVADEDNNRIDEFSAAGAFIKAYGWGVADGLSQFETCTTTCQAGIGGGGAGQLYAPVGVAVDPSGDVYVADAGASRIDEFSAAGSFIKAYGWGVSDGAYQFETCTSTCQIGRASVGAGAGELAEPSGVATDSSGDVYVADTGYSRIDEFSAAGSFIQAYGWGVVDGLSQFETCTSTCQTGLYGGGAGQLGRATGVAVDPSGDVYVADAGETRIDEFSGSLSPGPPAVAPPANTSPPMVPPVNNTSYTLSVSLAGTGMGSVSGSGISCPGTCLNNYASGTVVTLTATPSAGSTFAGWSGCDTTDADFCAVTITADRGVTAAFTRKKPACGTTIVARLICAAKKLKSVAACSAEIAAFGPLKALKFIKVIKGLYNTHKYPEALQPVYKLYDYLMKVRFRNGLTGAEVWKKLQRATSISELVQDVADSTIFGLDPSGEHFQEFAKDFADLVGVGDCVDLALAIYDQD